MAVCLPIFHPPDYQTQFRDSIQRSIEYVLARIERITSILPRDVEELALHSLDLGLQLDEAWPLTRRALLILAPKMEQAGYRDEWIPFLERGIMQAQRHADGEAEAELRLQLGILLRLRGMYEAATIQLERSHQFFADKKSTSAIARALIQLAYLHCLQRRYPEARGHANESISITLVQSSEQAYGLLVLGIVELESRNFQKSIELFREALHIWQRKRNQRMTAWSLTNLGAALQSARQYDEAIVIYKTAIGIFREIYDPIHLALAQMNLGNVYLSLEQPQDALTLYLDAKLTFAAAQELLRLAYVEHNMGMAYRQLHALSNAEQAFSASIDLFAQIGNHNRMANGLDELGLVYMNSEEYAKAATTFNRALVHLELAKQDPSFDFLFDMISQHLAQAENLL